MVRWGCPSFMVEAELAHPGGAAMSAFDRHCISVAYGEQRQMWQDGKAVGSGGDFINSFLCVALVPEDIGIVKGTPLLRRRFMDMLLCQLSREYLRDLVSYNRALSGRNAMLKDPARYGEKAIRSYDLPLAAIGARLTLCRQRTVRDLGAIYRDTFQALSGERPEADLRFASSIFRQQTNGVGEAELDVAIMACLEREYGRDAERRTTRFGPHRDDLSLSLFKRPLAAYGSEGQCRLAALALKLAAMKLLVRTVADADVVLLIDDVFGELDNERRRRFFAEIGGVSQGLLACTSVPGELSGIGQIFRMDAPGAGIIGKGEVV